MMINFILKKNLELPDETETVISIDRGEVNLAVTAAASRKTREASEGAVLERRGNKRIIGLYNHVRRKLQTIIEYKIP